MYDVEISNASLDYIYLVLTVLLNYFDFKFE